MMMEISDLLKAMISFYYLFFFSSRRRHTRFDCDWSSDVCSSDLQSARCRYQYRPSASVERPVLLESPTLHYQMRCQGCDGEPRPPSVPVTCCPFADRKSVV